MANRGCVADCYTLREDRFPEELLLLAERDLSAPYMRMKSLSLILSYQKKEKKLYRRIPIQQ